jgi:hypothetical protein
MFATSEDFSQVVVEIQHASFAYELLERIYGARNCKLDNYARNYRETHGIEGIEKILKEIDARLEDTSDARRRFHHIWYELFNCPEGAKVRKTDLADEFDIEPKTIQKDIIFFKDNHLINPNVQKGYKPEPSFFQVWDYLGRLNKEKYCFGKSWRKIYPR